MKLLSSYLILQISHTKEVLPGLLFWNGESNSHAFKPLLLNDWLLPTAVTIEDTVSQLAEVLLIAVFGHVLQELHKFLLPHCLLVSIVLLHEGT